MGQGVGGEGRQQRVQSQWCKLMQQFHKRRKDAEMGVGSDSAMGCSFSPGRANRIHFL